MQKFNIEKVGFIQKRCPRSNLTGSGNRPVHQERGLLTLEITRLNSLSYLLVRPAKRCYMALHRREELW